MTEGLVPPCLELGRAEHQTLRWLTRHSNKKGLIPLDQPTLAERINRQVLHGGASPYAVLIHLHDGGCLRKVDGEGFEVLVFCYCEKFGGELSTQPHIGASPTATIRRSRVVDRRLLGLVERSEAKPEELQGQVDGNLSLRQSNVRSPVPGLVDAFFEVAVNQGLMQNWQPRNGGALGANIKQWIQQGMSVSTVRDMIEEFVKHPEWCRRSRASVWKVFVYRRDELATILATRQRRDPGNRKYAIGTEYWLGRHTPRAYSST